MCVFLKKYANIERENVWYFSRDTLICEHWVSKLRPGASKMSLWEFQNEPQRDTQEGPKLVSGPPFSSSAAIRAALYNCMASARGPDPNKRRMV